MSDAQAVSAAPRRLLLASIVLHGSAKRVDCGFVSACWACCVQLQELHRSAASRAVGVAVMLYSLLFTVMVSKVAEPFQCEDGSLGARGSIGSKEDDISCLDSSDNTWIQLVVSSSLAATIFVLLGPAYLLRTISANRSDSDQHFETRYGWMYLKYRAEFWFWEFIVMARKVLFVGLGLLRDEKLLWAAYLGGTTLALALQVWCRPFDNNDANRVERSHLVVQVTTVALGGAFTLGLDKTSFLATIISLVLIVINFYMLWPVLVVAHGFLQQYSGCYRAVVAIGTKCTPAGCRRRGSESMSSPLLIGGSE